MDKIAALDTLMVLRAGLPGAYLRITEADTAAMVSLWTELFADYPGDLVIAAAKTYIWKNQDGRFPGPGSIREMADTIQIIVQNCSYWDSLQEYMGDSTKNFPPSVRRYIEACAEKKRAKRLKESSTRQAIEIGESHGE